MTGVQTCALPISLQLGIDLGMLEGRDAVDPHERGRIVLAREQPEDRVIRPLGMVVRHKPPRIGQLPPLSKPGKPIRFHHGFLGLHG